MGDTATRLAVRLMGNVAQGKGGTLPLDTVSLSCVDRGSLVYVIVCAHHRVSLTIGWVMLL